MLKKILRGMPCMLLIFSLYSENELGEFESARRDFPEVFIPKNINEIQIAGRDAYVICALATKDFNDDSPDKDTEIYAKNFLLLHLTKNAPDDYEVELKHFSRMYSWVEGKASYSVFYVFKENVSITPKLPPKNAKDQPHEAKLDSVEVKTETKEPGDAKFTTPAKLAEALSAFDRGDYFKSRDLLAKINPLPDKYKTQRDLSEWHCLVLEGVEVYANSILIADYYFERRKYDEASTYYKMALDDSLQKKTQMPENCMEKYAISLYNSGKLQESLTQYTELKAIFPLSEKSIDYANKIFDIKKEITQLK